MKRRKMVTLKSDPHLVDVLTSLNKIGTTINQISVGSSESINNTLRLIVESAIKVVECALAVIYIYDENEGSFVGESRVSSSNAKQIDTDDLPRRDGLGMNAIAQNRRVLSYEEKEIGIHPAMVKAGVKVIGCFPLIVADKPLGALYVYRYDEKPFSQMEILMMDNFVNQAAMAIYQAHNLAQVHHVLTRKEEELIRLRKAGLLISSRVSLSETLDSILQMAMEVTGAQYGIFRLLDKSGKFLITRAIAGEQLAKPLLEALPVDSNSVMAWVARNRQAICIADLRDKPWSQIYYPLDASIEMRSELTVPLIGASGRLEGVLNLESPVVSAFTEDDSHLLQALATQAVITIQEARLLDALQEVTHLLLTLPCQEVLTHLADLARNLLDSTSCVIWSYKDQRLILDTSIGENRSNRPRSPEMRMALIAVKNRMAITTDNLIQDNGESSKIQKELRNTGRALVVPLLSGSEGEPIGAMGIFNLKKVAGQISETDWDKKVLISLANYAVLAYQNAARQDALRTLQDQRSVAETFAVVGDVASNLLHQLNNEVGTIPVRIQGIEEKCHATLASNPYLAHNLQEIEQRAIEAMESVKENLIHLRPIHVEPISVSDCAADAFKTLKLPPTINIQIGNLDKLPYVMASKKTLTLVFINILENASEAMKGHGIIRINGKAYEKWIQISISDDGPGIEPRIQEHIFELDYSSHDTAKPSRLGFGLWWVKTLVFRLGGSVNIESDGVHGTTFNLLLPVVKELVNSHMER